MGRVSYFSDFIFMQQLMTLEIDIIVGMTEETLRHSQDPQSYAEKKRASERRNIDMNRSFDINQQSDSNMHKIKVLER